MSATPRPLPAGPARPAPVESAADVPADTSADTPERTLVARLRAGDREVFERLAVRALPALMGTATRLLRDCLAAEEAVAEALLRAHAAQEARLRLRAAEDGQAVRLRGGCCRASSQAAA